MEENIRNEKVEDGVSLIELFNIIWKRKVMISIITFVTMIIFLICVVTFINPTRATYKTTLDISFLKFDNGRYPSGAVFNYKNIIADENIEAVIQTNSDFNNIVVDQLNDGVLRIDAESSTDYTNLYTITASAQLFKTEELAIEFMTKLVALERERMIDDYKLLTNDIYLKSSVSANTFEGQLSSLQSQIDYLNDSIENMTNMYGDCEVDGKKLLTLKKEFDSYFVEDNINTLLGILPVSSFVKNYDYSLFSLNSQVLYLKKQIESNDLEILVLESQRNELLAQGDGSSLSIESYNSKIIELSLNSNNLKNELYYVELKIKNGNYDLLIGSEKEEYDTFVSKIDVVYNLVYQYTEEVTMYSSTLFDRFLNVNITTRNVVEKQGEVSLLLTALLAAVFGAGASSVIFICIDLSKEKEQPSI